MHIETDPSGVDHLVVDDEPDRRRCATCGHAHEWGQAYTGGASWDADRATEQLLGISDQLHQVTES